MTTNIDFQPHATKQERYQTLLPQLKALLEHETDPIANLANFFIFFRFQTKNLNLAFF